MDPIQAACYGTAVLLALYPAWRARDVWQRERRWIRHLSALPTDTADRAPVPDSQEDRFIGCLIGGAIGDALGRLGESLPPWLVRLRFGTITTFHTGLLRRVRGVGSVTDDTQLTLCLARSIGDSGLADEPALIRHLVAWYAYRIGPGKATVAAVRRLASGIPWDEAGDRHSGGNGTVIRVAPIGLVWSHDTVTRHQQAEWSVRGTHGHPLAVSGARLVADAVAFAVQHHSGTPADLIAWLKSQETDPTWQTALQTVLDLHGQAIDQGLMVTGRTGFVLDTVRAALFLFQELGDRPEAALIAAANAGGDTDSIGAVLGNLLGAWHGYQALPERWKRQVQGHAVLVAEARRLNGIHTALPHGAAAG